MARRSQQKFSGWSSIFAERVARSRVSWSELSTEPTNILADKPSERQDTRLFERSSAP
jgi:hypothetical protein